jgi:hypothetical protein
VIAFACIALTAAALIYTFSVPDVVYEGREQTRVAFLHERKEAVYENLRDLNFEYKAGKLPDSDYLNMKNSLEQEAASILAEISRSESGAGTIAIKKGRRR